MPGDPFGNLRGGYEVSAGARLVEVRQRFAVSQSGAATAWDSVFSLEYTWNDYADYRAETALHVVAPAGMSLGEVTQHCHIATFVHLLENMSSGCRFVGETARVKWPANDREEYEDMTFSVPGRTISQPVPGLLNSPWRLKVDPGSPRRAGRMWWPGLPGNKVDYDTLTLRQSDLHERTFNATNWGQYLWDHNLGWCVSNPEKNGGVIWPVTGVTVSAALRSYRRRRAKRPQLSASGFGLSTIAPFPPFAQP